MLFNDVHHLMPCFFLCKLTGQQPGHKSLRHLDLSEQEDTGVTNNINADPAPLSIDSATPEFNAVVNGFS